MIRDALRPGVCLDMPEDRGSPHTLVKWDRNGRETRAIVSRAAAEALHALGVPWRSDERRKNGLERASVVLDVLGTAVSKKALGLLTPEPEPKPKAAKPGAWGLWTEHEHRVLADGGVGAALLDEAPVSATIAPIAARLVVLVGSMPRPTAFVLQGVYVSYGGASRARQRMERDWGAWCAAGHRKRKSTGNPRA